MTYRVTVDYDRPIEDLVAAGGFGYANPVISSRAFPSPRTGRRDLEIDLLGFPEYLGLLDVQQRLDARGLRPVEVHELLALAAAYPDLQRRNPIIALGSVTKDERGRHDAPYLYRWDDDRHLRLDLIDDAWSEDWRFAVVRDETPPADGG